MPRPNQEFRTVRSGDGSRHRASRTAGSAATPSSPAPAPKTTDSPPEGALHEVITHSWNRLRRHYGQCRAAAPNLPDGEAGTRLTNDDRVLSQESYVDIDVHRNSRVMAGCLEERAIQGNPGGCMSTREVALSQDVSNTGLLVSQGWHLRA